MADCTASSRTRCRMPPICRQRTFTGLRTDTPSFALVARLIAPRFAQKTFEIVSLPHHPLALLIRRPDDRRCNDVKGFPTSSITLRIPAIFVLITYHLCSFQLPLLGVRQDVCRSEQLSVCWWRTLENFYRLRNQLPSSRPVIFQRPMIQHMLTHSIAATD